MRMNELGRKLKYSPHLISDIKKTRSEYYYYSFIILNCCNVYTRAEDIMTKRYVCLVSDDKSFLKAAVN